MPSASYIAGVISSTIWTTFVLQLTKRKINNHQDCYIYVTEYFRSVSLDKIELDSKKLDSQKPDNTQLDSTGSIIEHQRIVYKHGGLCSK